MQARLPDINTAIIRHRNNALQCFAGNDDVGAALSISAWNALMPDEYKVEVNTIKYNKLVAEKKTISCDYCKEDIPYNEIEFYDILLSRFESFLAGKKWKKCWRCKDCKKENTVNLAKIKIIKFQQPDYIKIIPDPPQRGAGIEHRLDFLVAFNQWFKIAMDEIENQVGLYRTDYAAQMDSMQVIPEESHE